jgi:hypothetical protein
MHSLHIYFPSSKSIEKSERREKNNKDLVLEEGGMKT